MVPVGSRKKVWKLYMLTLAEKTSIVHKILIKHEKQAEVAREFRIKPMTVQALTNKARNNRRFLQELREAKDDQEAKERSIAEVAERLNQAESIIDNTDNVRGLVKRELDQEVSVALVRKVLRQDLGMSYRKVTKVSLHANSEKNKVLRQQWALAYLKLWQ